MLEFFRRHQRIFFIFVTIVIVISFSFFGTYSAMGSFERTKEVVVGHAIDGSKLTYRDISNLAQLLSAEKDRSGMFVSCFLKPGVAERLATPHFEALQEAWQTRLDRLKRVRFYVHPRAQGLNAKDLWIQLAPEIMKEMRTLQETERVTPEFFSAWSRLYLMQELCPPELIKRVLMYQQSQLRIPPDPHLPIEDFSLCGYRTIQDWFGRDFLELTAQFILNGAIVAKEQGFEVSETEVRSSLSSRFDEKWLHSLGLKKTEILRVWRKALSFQRYVQSIGQAVFTESLPYRQFAEFAGETATIDVYQLPSALQLQHLDDFIAFEAYAKVACLPSRDFLEPPESMRSLEEVEKLAPELLFRPVTLRYAKVELKKVASRISMKEVWDWQLTHWKELQSNYPGIADASESGERFSLLEKLDPIKRAVVDDWTRSQMVQEHPEWIEQELALAVMKEGHLRLFDDAIEGVEVDHPALFRTHLLAFSQERYCERDAIYQFADVSVGEREILSFAEAKERERIPVQRVLEEIYQGVRDQTPSSFKEIGGEWKSLSEVKELVVRRGWLDLLKAIDQEEKKTEWERGMGPLDFYISHRFSPWMRRVFTRESQRESPEALPSGNWMIECKERTITRTMSEEWMMKMPFILQVKQWSPVHVPPNGDIVFFFVKEKHVAEGPILEQIQLGKETIAADAECQLADRLLEVMLKKQALVCPLKINEE